MVSGEISTALKEGNEQFDAREQAKQADQRRWEEMMEQRHHNNQMSLIRQLNAGQLQCMQMFSSMFQAASGQNLPSPSQGHTPPPYAYPTRPSPFIQGMTSTPQADDQPPLHTILSNQRHEYEDAVAFHQADDQPQPPHFTDL